MHASGYEQRTHVIDKCKSKNITKTRSSFTKKKKKKVKIQQKKNIRERKKKEKKKKKCLQELSIDQLTIIKEFTIIT